jgi:hypothetical protein
MKQEREAIIDEMSDLNYTTNGNYQLRTPPKPNWKIDVGNGAMVITHHVAKPPNALQRWLMQKLLCITWTRIE